MYNKLEHKIAASIHTIADACVVQVQADIREARSGLGSKGKHSLDTAGSESAAKHQRLVKRYSEVVARETQRSQQN